MIYDCFLFYDEEMMLKLRLETLSDHIDKFVIVESTHSFTGNPKPLNFKPDNFSKFKDKIIYVVFDQQPHADAWQNESDTRNAIMQGLKDASNDDLILIADVDEIYDPKIIPQINPRKLCTTIYQNFYNYQFNLQVLNNDGTPRLCKLPKAVSYYNLTHFFRSEPETLRNVKRKNSFIRKNWFKWQWLKINSKIIKDGGWHFSWIMTPEQISKKMSSISHTEYDLPEFNNEDHIIQCIKNGQDIWSRDRKFIKKELNKNNFPDYLVENRLEYKKFIL